MIYTLDKLKNEIAYQGLELEIDFKDMLKDQSLMLDIDHVKVTGQVTFINSRMINFDLKVEANLTLPCAISLKPVRYPLSFEFEEIVSDDLDSEYKIVEDKVDLKAIVWGAIIPEIPMAVYADDADHSHFEETKAVNEVFAQLKDHFDKK